MTSAFTRILALVTFAAYLTVGAFVVRVTMPDFTSVTLTSDYLSLSNDVRLADVQIDDLKAPIMDFVAIELPVKEVAKKIAVVKAVAPRIHHVAKNELPFGETIKVEAVNFATPVMTNHLALFKAVSPEVIAMTEDAVSVKQSKSEEFPEP